MASLSLLYRYYFGRCSSELAELVPLPFSQGGSTRYSDRLHDYLSPFLDITRMSMSTVSFLPHLGISFILHFYTDSSISKSVHGVSIGGGGGGA